MPLSSALCNFVPGGGNNIGTAFKSVALVATVSNASVAWPAALRGDISADGMNPLGEDYGMATAFELARVALSMQSTAQGCGNDVQIWRSAAQRCGGDMDSYPNRVSTTPHYWHADVEPLAGTCQWWTHVPYALECSLLDARPKCSFLDTPRRHGVPEEQAPRDDMERSDDQFFPCFGRDKGLTAEIEGDAAAFPLTGVVVIEDRTMAILKAPLDEDSISFWRGEGVPIMANPEL